MKKKLLILALLLFGLLPMVQNSHIRFLGMQTAFGQIGNDDCDPGEEFNADCGDCVPQGTNCLDEVQVCGYTTRTVIYEGYDKRITQICDGTQDCETGEVFQEDCYEETETFDISDPDTDPCEQMGGYYDNCLNCVFSFYQECDYEEDPPENNDPPNPCDQVAQQAGADATNLFNKSAVQGALANTPVLLPSTPQDEVGFSIRQNSDGSIYTSNIQTLGSNGGVLSNYPNSMADYHTHPYPGASAPSAQDLFSLDAKQDAINGFTTSYVQAADGSKYALYIDDAQKFNTFISNNPGFVGSDNNFKLGTGIGDKWEATKLDLVNQGYSSQEAYERATALVLKDSGVSLLKSTSVPDDFKKIDIKQKQNADGTPKTDANGKPIYENQDCN